jgi:hypothetical protein
VPSCAEGAIKIINGKARLIGDNLCDGLGACLGECPEGAITVEEREADEFDEVAAMNMKAGSHGHQGHAAHQGHQAATAGAPHEPCGCPGAAARDFRNQAEPVAPGSCCDAAPSQLRQWPIQLHLLAPTASFLKGADLVLAADCVAFSFGDFHNRFLAGKAIAIACPKLDSGLDEYVRKLTAMIDLSALNTITVVVMEVPCCNGLLSIAAQAVAAATRKVPLKLIRVGLQGSILDERWV